MRRTRTTLDHVGSAERRFNNWLRCKLSETDEVTKKKKYRQREVAEYIGISQQHLSAPGQSDPFNKSVSHWLLHIKYLT